MANFAHPEGAAVRDLVAQTMIKIQPENILVDRALKASRVADQEIIYRTSKNMIK